MARPRKAPEERKNVTLRIYVTAAEADALYVAALRSGLKDLSKYARAALLHSVGRETEDTTQRAPHALP